MALFLPQNENDFLAIKSGFNARLKPSYLVVRARFFFVNEYFGLVYYYCIWFEYLLSVFLVVQFDVIGFITWVAFS